MRLVAALVAVLAGAALLWTPSAGPPERSRQAARSAGPPVVVGCRERVEGYRRRVPARARREGVVAGPLVMPWAKGHAEQPAWLYREEPARPRSSLPTGRRRPDHYLAHKSLVVVEPGARVTVSGPPDLVGFAYGPGAADSVRIPGGPPAVTFEACPPRQRRFSGRGRLRFTEFAGGIAVAGPGCVPIDVRDEASGETWQRRLSFGTRGGGCPNPVAARPVQPVTLSCGDGAPLPEDALLPDWRSRSVTGGPLALAYARDLARQPPNEFEPARRRVATNRLARRVLRNAPPNGYGIAEAMVLIEPGHTATLVVPQLSPRRLALVYSPRARGAERPGAPGFVRIGDGDTAVRFESCPGAERTHFLGGIVAAGAGCAPLDVHPDGGASVRVRIGLGARCG